MAFSVGGVEVAVGTAVLTADTSQYDAAMARVGTSATAATGTIMSRFTEAAKALNSSPIISNAETISALFIQMGGSVSRAASVVTSLIRPMAVLSSTAGGLAVPIAALASPAVGVLALAGGLKVLADSAVEASGRLEGMGIAVSAGAAQGLRAYSDATEDLGVAFDQLTAEVGGEFAADLAVVVSAVAGGVRAFISARDAVAGFTEKVQTGLRIALAIGSVGLTELARAGVEAAAAMNDVAEKTERVTETVVAWEEKTRDQLVALGMMVSIEDEDRAAKDRLRAAEKALKEEEERHLEVMKVIIEGYRMRASASDAALDAEVDAIRAAREAQSEAYDAQSEEIQAILDARIKAADEAAAADARVTQQGVINSFALTGNILGNIAAIEGDYVSSLQRREAAGESLSKAEIDAGNRAIKAQRDLSLEQAGISATLAGISTYVALTTELVPPPIAAGIALGVTTASFAAAASGIMSGTPEFFDYRGDEHDGTPNAPYEPYHHNPDDPPGFYGSGGASRPEHAEGGHGAARTRGGRGRRDPVMRVEIVRDARGSGKLRR